MHWDENGRKLVDEVAVPPLMAFYGKYDAVRRALQF